MVSAAMMNRTAPTVAMYSNGRYQQCDAYGHDEVADCTGDLVTIPRLGGAQGVSQNRVLGLQLALKLGQPVTFILAQRGRSRPWVAAHSGRV
jgi:hypothetical protein